MTLYQQIRLAGRSMHAKVMETARLEDFDAIRIARRMTLRTSGRTLIFDGEAAQNAFIDFWFAEYRVNGKSLVGGVDPVTAGLDPLETEVLEAYRQARTSFFMAEEVSRDREQVHLRDLLEPDQAEFWLTDQGFSASLYHNQACMALFCRVVTLRGLSMTSGFSFGFDPTLAPGIVQAYRQKTKRIAPPDLSEARFVFFYQKHRQAGVDQEYRDVV
jgi:hypothetical protein